MTTLHIDFETRSTLDLKKVGAHVYADHATTDVWCLALALDDEPIQLIPQERLGDDDTRRTLRDLLRADDIAAHNAAFELVVWNRLCVPRYFWPELPRCKVRCTMAQAYTMGLPGDLDRAAKAVGLPVEKDMAGNRLMRQMARPRRVEDDGTVVWWDDADRLQRLYDYCRQDVEVERQLDARLRPLTPAEREVWQLDQIINDRGVRVDVRACETFLAASALFKDRVNDRMNAATAGVVPKASLVAAIREWCNDRLPEDAQLADLQAATLDEVLQTDLPEDVRTVLRLRRAFAQAAASKFQTMLTRAADVDDRVRGLVQYHGAHTGRWSGRGIQVHNLKRLPEGFELEDMSFALELAQ